MEEVTLTLSKYRVDLVLSAMRDSANELIACGDDGLAEIVLGIASEIWLQVAESK
jgi:hypothetical protein